MNKYIIYSDGSLKGNWQLKDKKPLQGGYAAIICDDENNIIKEIFGGYIKTTSPRAELFGVLEGLKSIKEPSEITIVSDSQYIVNTVNGNWLPMILERPENFSNADLWQKIADLLDYHAVTFEWVKGHADNEMNNRADWLAQFAARLLNLPEDEYTNNRKESRESLVSQFNAWRPDGLSSRSENGNVLYTLG